VQRQDHKRQQQRDRELDANREYGLAQPGNSITMAPDAGEYQHEGGGERGQQGNIMRMVYASCIHRL